MNSKSLIAGIILFITSISIAKAQVTISPTMVFFNSNSKFGTLLILNGSNQTQEISIEFLFGYPTSDSLGNTKMIYGDSLETSKFSIAHTIRGFPRTFTLAPNQRQVVRLTVKPNSERTDGMYWTRIKTTSNPETPPIGQNNSNGVSAQINFRFQQITTAFYKKGNLNTELSFRKLKIKQDSNGWHALADMKRLGNAPFLGSIYLKIYDNNGNIVQQNRVSTTVYFDELRKMDFDGSQLKPGTYKAELTFKSQRPDIAQEDLVPLKQPVSKTTTFTVR